MTNLLTAQEARELSKNTLTIKVNCVLNNIKERAQEGYTSLEIHENDLPGGLRLKLKQDLGFTVSGAVRNSGANKFIISWE